MVPNRSHRLMSPVLVRLLLAPCPQCGEQGLTTFLNMGGIGYVIVPLRIVQKCAAYGAIMGHFCCGHTGKVNK